MRIVQLGRRFGMLIIAIVVLLSMTAAPLTAAAQSSSATSHPTKPGYPWTTHPTRVPGVVSTLTLTNCNDEVDGYYLSDSGNWAIGGAVFCNPIQQSISMTTYFDEYVNGQWIPWTDATATSPWGNECFEATYCEDDQYLDLPSGTYLITDFFSVADYNNNVSGDQQYMYLIVP